MRASAKELKNEINLPEISSSFFIDLKPRRILLEYPKGHAQTPEIIIGENGTISVELRIEVTNEINHAYDGLHRHLETSGFSEVLINIVNWKNGLGQYLEKCHQLMTIATMDVNTQPKIPDDYVEKNEKTGYKVSFFTSACADAIDIAKGNAPVTDSGYNNESLTNNLWLTIRSGTGGIYVAKNTLGTKRCINRHKSLALKISKSKEAKELVQLRSNLDNTGKAIREKLQVFIDKESLPGNCDLE